MFVSLVVEVVEDAVEHLVASGERGGDATGAQHPVVVLQLLFELRPGGEAVRSLMYRRDSHSMPWCRSRPSIACTCS